MSIAANKVPVGSTLLRSILSASSDAAVAALLNPALVAQGLIAQTYDRSGGAPSLALLVDGTAYFTAIPLFSGSTVTNISVPVSVAAVGMTLSKVGLYDSAGNRLAVSADQGAAWESTGMKTIAVVTPYAVPTSGLYYAALVAKATVTLPTVLRSSSGIGTLVTGMTAIGAGKLPVGTLTAQTDLAATAAITLGSPSSLWIGIS